jgi:hypothetical protein
LARGGARLGHRTAFIPGLAGAGGLCRGLAGALLIYRLTWALTAIDGSGHVLTRQLGLLLFACNGWGCRRDGTSGGDGSGHSSLGRSAAVG